MCGNSTQCNWISDDSQTTPGLIVDSTTRSKPILKITDQFSGDNYQIEASFDSNFSCSPNCPKSGILKAWKRAYIEHAKMWKTGEFITNISGQGTADPKKVFVSNVGGFHNNDWVWVLSADHPEGERRQIGSVDRSKKIITLMTGLSYQYPSTITAQTCDPNLKTSTFNPYCALYPYSFIALESGGEYDIMPASMPLTNAFDDPYLEWRIVNGYHLPSWPSIPGSSLQDVSDFIQARARYFFMNKSTKNYIQVASIADYSIPNLQGFLYGITRSDSSDTTNNWTWIFSERLKTVFGADATNATANTTAHELGHQWNVNLPGDGTGHDFENAWQPLNSDPYCLMNQSRNRRLGIDRFHTNLTTAPTKDLYCIRRHIDDLFQNVCVWP